ncbi:MULTISPECIES: TonB-dependent siderophore receptor [Chryseobacterium]|uniref:Iron complex outermembrane receptor protein n=1 Tax=Chryseobacterium geocarposphaerae TaxID=1416776 RepID=A0ABU1LCT9_9FLAO|nr:MULTISPECIES: TonB-dependent siderophore receptor [Chryseobacterium]MDR6404541.1 iron complex outermembrane receptor protein [Chryseobacterium geocarposphaerae]MDR6698227.1 iron complex outermembrane receptor protein [Chryseobacterium ginsenosidimutans]
MKKQLVTLGLLFTAVSLGAQLKNAEADTIRIQTIEDVNLHKTGNPNKARTLSTKSNLTVMENPQPIAIVTHEVIEQQQAKQLSDVIKNVNGIYLTSARGGSQDSFGGRGFTFGNDNIFKNGAKVNSGVFPEVSGLERVEVLKGANAMLYGNVGPGGIVNLITKKPKFEFGGAVGFSAGSWNSYKPTVDIYGPLSKNIAFRVNGAYEYAESFRGLVESKKNYFNPSFAFNLSENTQLIVEGDYLYHTFTPDFGIGSVVDNATGISRLATEIDREQFLGTNWQYQTNQQATTDVILNHKFNNNWSLNAVAAYQNYTKDYFSTERVQWVYNSKNNNLNPSWTRPLGRNYTEQNYTSLQINLNGEFNTGSLNHKVLFGTDGDIGQADTYNYKIDANTPVVLFLNDPSTWTNESPMPNTSRTSRNRIKTKRYGFYAQDLISLTKEFKVLAGIRWSSIQNDDTRVKNFATNETIPTANSGTKETAFSPKVGLIYNPNENLSVFATYTNSFVPNTGFDQEGFALEASTVDQYEIGIKKNLWNNAVAVNLTAYQINNRDTYTAPYTQAGAVALYRVYAGNIRSRGVELDITGNPLTNLSLIGGVSYNNAVYTKTPDNGFLEEQRLVRTPAVTANASAFYTFKSFAKGLKIGATVFYTGDRKAGWNDVKNQPQVTRMIDVEGFTTVDFSLGYEWKKFMIQGKVGNLFDVVNYNVHENYSVNPITPRNYYFTLTYKL